MSDSEVESRVEIDSDDIPQDTDEGTQLNQQFNNSVPLPSTVRRDTRLIITHLELENFKSYGGVRKIGPFHQSFSAVVGPNGSGKSNVLDALLFAFGKRASKIRLNKVSELIHKSDQYKNLDFARVTVFFQEIYDDDNRGDIIRAVDGTAFSISRVAYKNNSSKYFIDSRASNFTEVTEMLMKKDIDLTNNRFLILQGEVEQISMMKPKAQNPHETGFLEYLEEIIGTNKYLEPLEKTSQKIMELTEVFQEKMNRLKVAEKELSSLEGSRNDALMYQATEMKSQRCTCVHYQLQVLDLSDDLNTYEQEVKEREESVQALANEIENLSSELHTISAEYEKARKESDQYIREAEESEKEFSNFQKVLIKKQEDLKFNKSLQKKSKTKISKDAKMVEECRARIDELENEVSHLELESSKYSSELEDAISAKDKVYAMVKNTTEPIRLELEQKQKELVPYSKETDELKRELSVLESQLKMIQNKSTDRDLKLQDLKEEEEKVQSEIRSKSDDLKSAKSELISNNKDIDSRRVEIKKADALNDELQRRLQTARLHSNEVRRSLEQESSKSRIAKELHNLRRKENLPGIFGRLGDLGCINAQFDVAISTAAPSLNNFLVDSTKTAQRCVSFLRQMNLGTATFIMLDKMTDQFHSVVRKVYHAPNGSQRIFDLIEPKEEKFLPAFYFALRDTLVTSDMDTAMAIAFNGGGGQKSRIVTLTGEMIDPSGVMSGGGSRKYQGAIKLRKGSRQSHQTEDYSEEDLKLAEHQVSTLEEELVSSRENLEKLKLELTQKENHLRVLTTKVSKIEAACDSGKKQMKLLQERIHKLESDAGTDVSEEQEIDAIQRNIAALEKKVKKSESSASHVQTEIERLNKKLMDAGGNKLKESAKKVADIEEKLLSFSSEINRCKVEREASIKQISRLEASIKKSSQDLLTANSAIESISDEISSLESEIEELENRAGTAKGLAKSKIEATQELKEHHDSKKKLHVKKQTLEIDLKAKLDEICSKKRDAELSLSKRQAQVEKLLEEIRQNDEIFFGPESADLFEGANIEELPGSPFELFSEEDLRSMNQAERKNIAFQVTMLDEALKKMTPNMSAIDEYKKKRQDLKHRQQDLESLQRERDSVREEYDTLRKRRLDEFMAGFSVITMKLKEMYQMLTLGGDAELELVDALDPFSEGIVFSVRPPKKSWKNISNLSGGEKTLSSLALVFSLHYYKPTPLYVMDEIDAALDFKNVSIVANYIKERTRNAQFIIISLRNNMFELGDRLVGIYKTNNVSQSITINPAKILIPQQPSQMA